jgi:hypothetical protein
LSKNFGFTLVQHSGYAWGGNQAFANGIEVVAVTSAKQVSVINDAGGIVFPSYMEADDFSYKVMYPGRDIGLIPRSRGGFGPKIGDLRVYVLAAADWDILTAA